MTAGAVTIVVNADLKRKEKERLIREDRRERELVRRVNIIRSKRLKRELF